MKKHYCYIVLYLSGLLAGSCQNPPAGQNLAGLTRLDTLPRQLTVSNRSQYSKAFLDSLKKAHYPGSMRLENDYIIVGRDTTRFPQDLKQDTMYHFTADKDTLHYNLNVERINLTDLQFQCSIQSKNKPLFEKRGQAMLGPLFFLAADVLTDEATGDSFGAYPYTAYAPGNYFVIDIGTSRNEHNQLRATISCDKKIKCLIDVPILAAK